MYRTRRFVGWALLPVLVLVGLPFISAAIGSSSAPSMLGVFRGSGAASQVEDYESWLGKPVGYALDFLGANPSTSDAPWSKIDDPSWWCRQWQSSSVRLVLSTAMLPNTDYSLAAGARGDYDDHWRKFGQSLVTNGCRDAIIRLGWEFNGRFYPWAAGGKEATYAAYWRRIVNTLRGVTNEAFAFDWSPLGGNTNADVAAAYPGDAYVDIIGLDAYDTSTVSTTQPDQRWKDQVSRTYGLAWQADFASAHGKAMSLPEWGVSVRAADDLGGGDNPYYISRMWEWMNSHSYTYASYFEYDAGDASHRLMTDAFPKSSAEYRKLVNNGTSTTTTSPTTSSTTSTTAAPTTSSTTTSSTTTSSTVPTTTSTTEPGAPSSETTTSTTQPTGSTTSTTAKPGTATTTTTKPTSTSSTTSTTAKPTTTTSTTVKLPSTTTTTVKLPSTTTTTVKPPPTTTTTLPLIPILCPVLGTLLC